MKRLTIFYWIVTGLVVLLMGVGSLPDFLLTPDAVALVKSLGIPTYLLPFLGTMKELGVVAILIPGYPKLKEWAYAGLLFDVMGAAYLSIVSGAGPAAAIPPVVAAALIMGSYWLYHRRLATPVLSSGRAMRTV